MTILRLLIVLVALGAPLAAADPHPPSPPDPIGDRLWPPDAIMSHQRELGIDASTRDKLVAEIQRFQTAAVKLQWDLDAAGDGPA